MQAYIDRQLGLEVYFPGTPVEDFQAPNIFPYHIWGTGKDPNTAIKSRQEDEEFRKQEGIRRRAQPSCIEEACVYGNLQAVVLFWAQGLDIPTRHTVYERSDATPLMWAAFEGHLPVVRFLVDQKAPLQACNALGHTALHWALSGGHPETAAYLLDQGADPNQQDRQGFDAAFAAVQHKLLSVLVMLIEKGEGGGGDASRRIAFRLDASRRDVQGHSLLHWAAYTNNATAIEYLLMHGAYDVNAIDSQGRTPLTWAAREGYAEVVECLLSHGADRTLADNDGLTPIQYCRLRNHHEARYVLDRFPVVELSAAGAARVAMMGSEPEPEGGDRTALLSASSSSSAGRYQSVRDRRRAGTLALMLKQKFVGLMAVLAVLYVVLSRVAMSFVHPMISHFHFGIFFFKNTLWAMILGKPVQGDGKVASRTIVEDLGIAKSLGEAVRGNCAYRFRDPSVLFAALTCVCIQLYAWSCLGLTPFFFPAPAEPVLQRSEYKYNPLKAAVTAATVDDMQNYFLGGFFSLFFSSAESMIHKVLLSLLLATLAFLVLCKSFASRSTIKPSEEGSWRSTPLRRIVAQRKFRFLHPRIFLLARHTQLPLRTFYCVEWDCIVRRFDGYSGFLECPIGQSNHFFFVLFISCFTAFEFLLLVWGFQQSAILMGANYYAPFYQNALFPFSVPVKETSPTLPVADTVLAPSGAVSFAWVNSFVKLALHGLPAPQSGYLNQVTESFVKARVAIAANEDANSYKQLLLTAIYWGRYLFFYYFFPTVANTLGVCVFHISTYVLLLLIPLFFRQWRGVWLAATRVEMANPIAPSETGEMVSIFPPNPTHAVVCEIDQKEEDYYATVAPGKAKNLQLYGGECIYSHGYGVLNVIMFLLGLQGRRWRGADMVSAFNAPVIKKL